MSDEKEVLKPCPFCGGNDVYVERVDLSSCAVLCNDCIARGPQRCTQNDEELAEEDKFDLYPGNLSAHKAWNNREGDTPS